MCKDPAHSNQAEWHAKVDGIVHRHMPKGAIGCTAGQYRAMIADIEAAVAAHLEWEDPCWGEIVFGCLGQGIRAWLQAAPDDDMLRLEYVNGFDHQDWVESRIRKGLPIRLPDGTFRAVSWPKTVQAIIDAHLPDPRRLQAARVYRAMIAEIASVIAEHPEWDDPDWEAIFFDTLGMGTWDCQKVAGDGDVLQEELMA